MKRIYKQPNTAGNIREPLSQRRKARHRSRPPQQKPFWKRTLLAIFVPLFGLLFALLAIEAGYRILTSRQTTEDAPGDRPAFYVKPDLATTMQDYYYGPQKKSAAHRIAVLGDSFTFAPFMQFDDAFPKRLERFLNLSSSNFPVEVRNYGVPGFSTSHELKAARRAIKNGATALLLQITLNDPQLKPYTPTGLTRANEFGEYQRPEKLQRILHYWKSLEFIFKRIHNSQTHTRYKDYYFSLFDKKKTWNPFQKSIERFSKLCQKNKISCGAIIFPLFGLPLNDQYPFHPIHEKIGSLLIDQQLPYLDLFEAFEGIPLNRIHVIPGKDFHPNEIGHRIAAEKIFLWMKEIEFLPPAYFHIPVFQQRIDIRPERSKPLKELIGLSK